MIKKIKNITSIAKENKKAILRKVLILGGTAAGLAAGVLLTRTEAPFIQGEVVEEETIEITVQ